MVLTTKKTKFEVTAGDSLIVYLNYKDLKKLNVTYILSETDISNKLIFR